jgi:hypothetical protein
MHLLLAETDFDDGGVTHVIEGIARCGWSGATEPYQ